MAAVFWRWDRRVLLYCSFWFVQLAMIIWTALEMALDDELFANFPMLKAGVVVAKCGAALINLNGALLLMSMSRALLTSFSRTWLGHFLSVAWLIPLHRWSGAMFIVGSVIHCGAHVANLVLLKSRGPVRWLHPTLVLGAVLVLLYLIISIPAFLNKRFSRISYEVFAYTHYLSPISMIILYLHGIFCFLKSDKGKCLSSPTIYWLAFPFSFYIADQIWSLYRFVQFAYLSKVIEHPSGVVEVQIRKPGFDFLPGQYVYLKAPAVSWLQWHPFTLTSAPEEDHISLHIRIAGDWTRAFWKVLQTKALERVRVFVDGPYGCASQDHEKYNAIICIGAGIGQTPFASILKSLWFRLNRPIDVKNVSIIHFVGICRNTKSFEWFNDILQALERSDVDHLLQMHLYVTGSVSLEEQALITAHHELGLPDPITGLKSATSFGRPPFRALFYEWCQTLGTKVGVFYCGPPALGAQIESLCQSFCSRSISFEYHEESF